MKKTFLILFLINTLILLSACDSAPKCSDKKVQKMAMEIACKSLRSPQSAVDNGSSNLIFTLRHKMARGGMVTPKQFFDIHNQFFKGRDVEMMRPGNKIDTALLDSINKVLDFVIDSSIDAGNIYLDAVTVNGSNDETRKCNCGAQLYDGVPLIPMIPIIYTAQYTEDNKILVEVKINLQP